MADLSNLERLRQRVEWQVLELIKRFTEIGKMTQDQAQRLAQHVLTCIKPSMTPTEFFKGVFKLDDGFPEVSFIVLPVAKKYHEQIDNPTTEYVRKLVHQHHYDEAVSLAQKLVNHEVQIKFIAKGKK